MCSKEDPAQPKIQKILIKKLKKKKKISCTHTYTHTGERFMKVKQRVRDAGLEDWCDVTTSQGIQATPRNWKKQKSLL